MSKPLQQLAHPSPVVASAIQWLTLLMLLAQFCALAFWLGGLATELHHNTQLLNELDQEVRQRKQDPPPPPQPIPQIPNHPRHTP